MLLNNLDWLVQVFAKSSEVERMIRFYNQFEPLDLRIYDETLNSMVIAYATRGDIDHMDKFWVYLENHAYKPNEELFAAMINATKFVNTDKMLGYYNACEKFGFKPTQAMLNNVVAAFSKKGDEALMLKYFEVMDTQSIAKIDCRSTVFFFC